MVYPGGGILMATNYYDGTLFLYYKSIEIDKEEDIKNRIEELEDIVENLTFTILDLIPEGEEGV